MANTSSRMLALLSLLQTHRYWPGTALADRLQVSIRTLRRDVDRLRELGYPVEAQRGVDGGYQLAVGASLPPLVLDDEEAVALTLGLLALTNPSAGGVTGMAESSVRALAKVVQVMPIRLRRRVEALRAMTEPVSWGSGGPTVDPTVLTTLAQACRDSERVRFGYTDANGTQTERSAEPLRLVPVGRRWYLVAYDLTRHDWRSFRLDRISDPSGTGAHFRPRELPAVDAATFVQAQLGQLPTSYVVDAVIVAPAATVRSRIGRWATVEAIDDETCRVQMTADWLEWPAFALGQVGAPFTVTGPPQLIDLLRDWAARFERATG